ncbi:hexokinase family protein [Pleomorphochaeta sp. DL1XJH-081]|uniref:hexokinase family protein n=1 Tax=Pleomorphochaeta sp. DL1XJH-081 TaxID=3409690 RepID=UPI003BB7622E
MKHIVARTESFLHEWSITPDSIDMQKCCDDFLKEMELGLQAKGVGSLAMIPTYTSADTMIEPERKVIVLDAGGTNFRTCVVSFSDTMVPTISSYRKTGMPGVHHEVTATEFFGALADQVEPLIDESDQIGFCFSYAAEITEDHDGIPLVFSKEIKAPQVIGMPVGKSLLDELARRGHDVSRKRVAVVNDTVATLLAGKVATGVSPYDGYIGFILGTGTNTAYVESNSQIAKLSSLSSGSQIINVESGNYELIPGELDRRFINSTKQPENYHFEKMISGAYLGSFSQVVLEEAIAERILSEEFAERFLAIPPLDTTRMSHYLEMPHNQSYNMVSCITNEADATALYLILDSIIARAAKLTAINLSAAVLKSGSGENPRYPVCINADGTTFYKTENLDLYTKQYVTDFLHRRHHRFVRFVNIDDSPTIGAAVAGLSLL